VPRQNFPNFPNFPSPEVISDIKRGIYEFEI